MDPPVVFLLILATITFTTGKAELYQTLIHCEFIYYIDSQFRYGEPQAAYRSFFFESTTSIQFSVL